MEKTVHELARMTQADVEQTPLTTRAYMARHRSAILQTLEDMGYEEVRYTRYDADMQGQPEIKALKNGRDVCICFGSIPSKPMELSGLSEEQYRYCCEAGDVDVYYACLLVNPHAKRLLMLGPVPLRLDGAWQTRSAEQSQYLPLAERRDIDRYSPIYGEASLFKLDHFLIPHVLEHGTLPRFTIGNLFADLEQGESSYYALMCGDVPSHLMLVKRGDDGQTHFRRPFFFGHSHPVSELELTRSLDKQPDCGVTELMDRTGRVIYAECLEAVLFPERMLPGKHYMWTLSLVANGFRTMKKAGSSPEEPAIYQEPHDTCTQLYGAISRIEETEIEGQRAQVWMLRPLPHNEEVEVQVYVGQPLLQATHRPAPEVGDVVEVSGFLYASPDELVETTESWQDSGEVAAMQESHQLESRGKMALRSHAPYSLAHAVVASAFAGAGYVDIMARVSHTRQDPTFIVRHEQQGYTALLFVDVEIGDAPPQFPYTEEQMLAILKRDREYFGAGVHAHHCTVRLERRGSSYAAVLRVEPECPGVPAVVESHELLPIGDDEPLSEARACRILGNAVCRQSWGLFAAIAHEDMTYASRMNGTKTLGKIEYIRYMAERKKLWESQQAWQGIELDTGSIEYVGVRRPCFMISCYGRMVGATVVTLHEGKVADVATLPPEANESFVKDDECTAQPRIFHPMQGHLATYAEALSPLQRFSVAYLQDCMIRKIGFCGATGSDEEVYTSDGVERRVDKIGARWAKALRYQPSFCDMAFTCAGRMYAVCAVEISAHPDNGGDIGEIVAAMGEERQKALRMAEAHHLIPCVFPVQAGHAPSPSRTWNLWDMRTLEPVTPTMEPGEEDAPISEWEVLYAALAEVARLVRKGGGELVACHDMPDLLPHLWFRDPHGRLSWIIIRPHTSVAYADRGPSEAELRAVRLTQGSPGYVVDAEPYQDHSYTKPATTRDQMRFVKVTMPLPLS